jgi:hypothetical protein
MDPVAVHEFDVEHGILVRVSHPHIIKIMGAGRIPRRFVVLEYLGRFGLVHNDVVSCIFLTNYNMPHVYILEFKLRILFVCVF